MTLGDVVGLDDDGLARLDQVLLGLAPVSTLPPGGHYLDPEGTPVARRDGDVVTALAPRPWPVPDPLGTVAPVVVAVPDRLPVGGLPAAEAMLLLPLGGVRVDDRRIVSWAHAWRAMAGTVVEVPVPPAEAAARAAELAAAYSSGQLLDVATVDAPQPAGIVLFFTGLSGSGKSTIAREVTRRLTPERSVTLLDGDVVRSHLSQGLGFGRTDRDTNIRRIGWVAAEVAKHGGVAICAPIAPYDETRRWVRAEVERAAGPGSFRLVWVSTPLEVCEARDVKGLYARARRGDLLGFTGLDDPYEPPTDAALVLDTTDVGLEEAVTRVLALLRDE